MLKDKSELIQNLTTAIESFKHKRNVVKQIKNNLGEYNISAGNIQKWINHPEEIENIDERTLCLFAEAVYMTTANLTVNPKDYFTERQIKEVKTTYEAIEEEKITFPYTFENVIKINDEMFFVQISDKNLKRLLDSNLIQYNPEVQREARTKTDKEGNIIQIPKVFPKSIKEIKQLRKTGELFSTVLTFNARLGTSETGEELVYDSKNNTLTITEGTLLDCLDGFHRLTALSQALTEDPSMDEMIFPLCIVNFSTKIAQNYFSQINTTNPIDKSRLSEMNQNKQSNFIAKQIQLNSELRGKVSTSDRIAPKSNFLVSFYILSNAIEEVFNIKDKLTAIEVSRYLTDFFNSLVLNFYNEFHENIVEVREKSLINANQMFYGYVVLAKRMRDENIPLSYLKDIVSDIDFSKENPLWTEMGVLNQDLNVKNNIKNKIKQFFMNLNLNKVGV